MTPELDSRPDDLKAEVEQILQDVDDQLAELDGDDEPHEAALGEFRALGGQASELLEDTDPKSLLVAVDSSGDPLDPEKDSLATVMEKSDSEAVAKLRTILNLSKLPDVDDGSLGERVDQIRDLRSLSGTKQPEDEAASGSDADEDADTDEADEAEAAEEDGGGEAEAAEEDGGGETGEDADADGEAADDDGAASTVEGEEDVEADAGDAEADAGDAEDVEAEDGGEAASETESAEADADEKTAEDNSEQLKRKLREGIDEFRQGIDSYRESLTGETEEESESEDTDSDSVPADTDSKTGGSRSRSGTGTRFSTMPSRNRVGIRGTPRFSTVKRSRNRNSE